MVRDSIAQMLAYWHWKRITKPITHSFFHMNTDATLPPSLPSHRYILCIEWDTKTCIHVCTTTITTTTPMGKKLQTAPNHFSVLLLFFHLCLKWIPCLRCGWILLSVAIINSSSTWGSWIVSQAKKIKTTERCIALAGWLTGWLCCYHGSFFVHNAACQLIIVHLELHFYWQF